MWLLTLYDTMTNITFVIHGQLPSGKNQVFINGKGQRYPNARFKAWKAEALATVKQQLHHVKLPLTNKVGLIVDYVPSDHRRRDVSGMLDAVCHLLEKAGVLVDDAQIKDCVWRSYEVDKDRSKATITVMGT